MWVFRRLRSNTVAVAILRCAVFNGSSYMIRCYPEFFWAKRNEFVLPEKLGAAVAARGVKVGDWQSLYEELAASLENQGQQWLALSRSKDELISALERRLSEQCPETLPEKALSTRERDSLLKLVIGMAVGGYGHDPKAKRSGQCAAIADDLAKTGVPLDVDTVRKWLREASDLLPGD
jgi:hypothetical protein